MNDDEKKLKELEDKLRKSSETLFKKKPAEIQEELERESVLGSPENLKEPADKRDD